MKTFKLLKKAPFSELRRAVEAELGVPAAAQRFWRWHGRQNGTYRPSSPLLVENEEAPVQVCCAC